ncbi:MAG: MarC family protein [Patescibacteria group bacterium]
MILSIVKAFFAVFGVMDPLGNTPVFLSLTERLDEKTKRSLATKAVIRAGIVLLVFVFLGNIILDFFHISLQSFRIAGGIILLLIGLQLLFGLRFSNEPEIMADDLSVVPLATPLIAGPGMITAVVIFSKEYGYLITIIGIVANLVLSWVLFRYANYIVKFLGKGGTLMFVKFMSLILVAIGVEFIRNGLGM